MINQFGLAFQLNWILPYISLILFLAVTLPASYFASYLRKYISYFPNFWMRDVANLCLFLFSSFRKGRLLYIRPVGWSVSPIIFPLQIAWLSPILTKYQHLPSSTTLYWPSTTMYQLDPFSTDPVPPSTNYFSKYCLSIRSSIRDLHCLHCLLGLVFFNFSNFVTWPLSPNIGHIWNYDLAISYFLLKC